MGPFLAYFPTWLRYHEICELGSYTHPFEYIQAQYPRDCRKSKDYEIMGDDWQKKFIDLKDFGPPFALLRPSMQEGSGISEPFSERVLSSVHYLMGLGSIWTIGTPLEPTMSNFCYKLFAYPGYWKEELPHAESRITELLPREGYSAVATIMEPEVKSFWPMIAQQIDLRPQPLIFHIGAILCQGLTEKDHPGWTTHLPRKRDHIRATGKLYIGPNFDTAPNTQDETESMEADHGIEARQSPPEALGTEEGEMEHRVVHSEADDQRQIVKLQKMKRKLRSTLKKRNRSDKRLKKAFNRFKKYAAKVNSLRQQIEHLSDLN